MSDTQEFKLLITGDATQGVAATQQMGDATRKLKVDVSDIGDETKRMLGITEPAAEGTKSSVKKSAKPPSTLKAANAKSASCSTASAAWLASPTSARQAWAKWASPSSRSARPWNS